MVSSAAGGVVRMPKRHRLAFVTIVIAMGSLPGCGSLDVKVDILDPTFVDAVAEREDIAKHYRAALSREDESELAALRDQHRGTYKDLASCYRQEAARLEDDSQRQALEFLADSLVIDFDDGTKQAYDETLASLKRIDDLIQSEAATIDPHAEFTKDLFEARFGNQTSYARVIGLLGQRIDSFNRLYRQVDYDLVGLKEQLEMEQCSIRSGPNSVAADASAEKIDTELAAQIADLQTKRDSVIGGQALTEFRYAYAVASADDRYWESGFNQTLGRGYFGNLNFAVKMEDLADFTIKGLTFDPSEVARVAARVTTQGMLTAAQLAGVPVALQGVADGTDGKALADRSQALATLEAEEVARQAKIDSQRKALRLIAERIISEKSRLGERNSVAALKTTFDAHKQRLVTSPASSN